MTLIRGFIFLVMIGALMGCSRKRPEGNTDLHGAWEPTDYVIAGTSYPMDGVMIITPRYFAANTTFRQPNGTVDANANSGPYYLEDGHIVLTQWMQLHYRPDNAAETYLTEDVVERIRYELSGDTLTFHFPSGNRYISRRLTDDTAAAGPQDLRAR